MTPTAVIMIMCDNFDFIFIQSTQFGIFAIIQGSRITGIRDSLLEQIIIERQLLQRQLLGLY